MMGTTDVLEMCHDCGKFIHGPRIYTQDESVFHPDCYPHGSAEDRDEITNLRAALERLVGAVDGMSWGNWIWPTEVPNALATARAALEHGRQDPQDD